jgi:hypothetical protein
LRIFASSRNGFTGEPTADVDEEHLPGPARLGLPEDVGRQVERLDVVVEVGGLASHVEGDALHREPLLLRRQDEVDRLARRGPELGGELDHGARVGHPEPQRQAGARRVLLDLLDLLEVVVGDERLVAVELPQRAVGLDGIRVDDLVPDPGLPLLLRHLADQLVDDHELRHRGHVEAGPGLEERLHDGRVGVGLHRVVGLHAGEVLPEGRVVLPQLVVIDDEERRPVLPCQLLQALRGDHVSSRPGVSRRR